MGRNVDGSHVMPEGAARESDVWAGTRLPDSNENDPVYVCQATQLPYATTDLAWWDVRQYFEDYWSGNVGPRAHH